TPQTITLSGTQLELSDTTGTETITGPKAGVTVSGGGNSRVFQIDGGVTASISGLTISGGNTGGNGGAPANLGSQLNGARCTVRGNSATAAFGSGGGVFSSGAATTLTDCAVSGNSASYGSGVGSSNGGTLALNNCTITGNTASGGPHSNGAGVDVAYGATATLN